MSMLNTKDDEVETPVVIAASVALAILLGVGAAALIATYQPPRDTLSDVVHKEPSGMGELLGVLRRLGH